MNVSDFDDAMENNLQRSGEQDPGLERGGLAAWPTSLPVFICGMAGSQNGWHEVPYVSVPAPLHKIADGIVRFESRKGRQIHMMPGLCGLSGPNEVRSDSEVHLRARFALHLAGARPKR